MDKKETAILLAEKFIFDDAHQEKNDDDVLVYVKEKSNDVWEVAYDLALIAFYPNGSVKEDKERIIVEVDIENKQVFKKTS